MPSVEINIIQREIPFTNYFVVKLNRMRRVIGKRSQINFNLPVLGCPAS